MQQTPLTVFFNFSPILLKYVDGPLFLEKYDFKLSCVTTVTKESLVAFDQIIDRQLIIAFILSLAFGVWYFLQKVKFIFL